MPDRNSLKANTVKNTYIKPRTTVTYHANKRYMLAASNNQDASLPIKDEYTDSPQLSKPWQDKIWQPWEDDEDIESQQTD